MKRKITALCLVVALLAVAIVGGTMAYFTDTDTATNVFTVGNVKIKVEEPNWDPDDVTTKMENIVPGKSYAKDPQVKNIGKNDAYVRMTVCFQNGVNAGGFTAIAGGSFTDLLKNLSSDWTLVKDNGLSQGGAAHIDGHENCWYAIFNYNKVLKPGETTAPLFTAVEIPEAWNQEFFTNYIGSEFQIDITAEAIQADGFAGATEAFAALSGDTITEVSTASDLTTALATSKVVKVTEDVDMTGATVALPDGATIIGDGESAISNVTFTVADEQSATFEGVVFDDTTTIQATADGALTFTNCEFEVSPAKLVNNSRAAAIIGSNQYNTIDLYLDGCTFNYEYEDGDADKYNAAIFMWSSVKNVVIKNCTFNDYGFVAVKLMNVAENANIVIDNNAFNMCSSTDANYWYNTAIQIVPQHDNAMSVAITNNKFSGDYQQASGLEEFGYTTTDTQPIVAEIAGMNYAFGLSNLDLTVEGNTWVTGSEVTTSNIAVMRANAN